MTLLYQVDYTAQHITSCAVCINSFPDTARDYLKNNTNEFDNMLTI